MVSVREKIAYGLGDTASNIVFQTVMTFLAFFYTDIFGISPAIVGTLFLVVRIFDAVTDPLMGALTDRTTSRHGQFRPYLIWLALPFGIISVLAFTTPELSESGKVIYAFVTYGLLMAAYTAINIPYSALGGVLTADPKERVSIQSYRFVCAMIGGLLVTAFTLPLVDLLGNGDRAKGYQLTIAAMSTLGVILFVLCFLGTKERVAPPVEQKTTVRNDMKSLLKNDQWRILCIAAFFLLTGLVLRSTLAIYYVKYFLGREDLITMFVTLGSIGAILGCTLSQFVAKRMCKIKAYIYLQLISGAIAASSVFIKADQIELAFIMFFLWSFFLQIATPLLWAKMADTVDYGHWKTGIRITGMVYSAIVFFIKMGLALGGAIAGWLLAYYGYQADTAQSPETLDGLLLSFTVFPAIGSLVVAYVMRWYILDDAKLEKIQQEIQTLNPQET
ncbi:MAG: GPH family glycoside/pentoside/hexuronide:cation symporter [Enterobacterales bacterium]|jgi:GPH family glycoside/pentoside/hexuronide:cation symporter